MLMRTIYDEQLAQAAYLVGCQATGEAILVDPLRDVDRYLALAESHGLRITAVAETHIHADFVSGARELNARTGAHVYVSGEGGETWRSRWLDGTDHTELRDGDTFAIGNLRFGVSHTPGHTPEHVIYTVTDHGADAPIGVLSGDFLFVGDLGRPDLLETAAGQAGAMEAGANDLHRSLSALESLPDFAQVWPGHGAGSACGKDLGSVPSSTIGYEKRFNAALGLASDRAGFVASILDGQPEPPFYFADMKRINRDGPRVLGGLPEPERMSPAEAASIDTASVALIDTRPWEAFMSGHVPGSLSLPLEKSFPTDAGSLVGVDEPVCLVVDERMLEHAVRSLIRIGIDRIGSWCDAAELTSSGVAKGVIGECGVGELREKIDAGGVSVLDVRRLSEFRGGHMPGAVNISHTRLRGRLGDVPQGDPVYVSCRSGKRSARACGYLKRLGCEVVNVKGGWLAWEKAGGEALTGA